MPPATRRAPKASSKKPAKRSRDTSPHPAVKGASPPRDTQAAAVAAGDMSRTDSPVGRVTRSKRAAADQARTLAGKAPVTLHELKSEGKGKKAVRVTKDKKPIGGSSRVRVPTPETAQLPDANGEVNKAATQEPAIEQALAEQPAEGKNGEAAVDHAVTKPIENRRVSVVEQFAAIAAAASERSASDTASATDSAAENQQVAVIDQSTAAGAAPERAASEQRSPAPASVSQEEDVQVNNEPTAADHSALDIHTEEQRAEQSGNAGKNAQEGTNGILVSRETNACHYPKAYAAMHNPNAQLDDTQAGRRKTLHLKRLSPQPNDHAKHEPRLSLPGHRKTSVWNPAVLHSIKGKNRVNPAPGKVTKSRTPGGLANGQHKHQSAESNGYSGTGSSYNDASKAPATPKRRERHVQATPRSGRWSFFTPLSRLFGRTPRQEDVPTPSTSTTSTTTTTTSTDRPSLVGPMGAAEDAPNSVRNPAYAEITSRGHAKGKRKAADEADEDPRATKKSRHGEDVQTKLPVKPKTKAQSKVKSKSSPPAKSNSQPTLGTQLALEHPAASESQAKMQAQSGSELVVYSASETPSRPPTTSQASKRKRDGLDTTEQTEGAKNHPAREYEEPWKPSKRPRLSNVFDLARDYTPGRTINVENELRSATESEEGRNYSPGRTFNINWTPTASESTSSLALVEYTPGRTFGVDDTLWTPTASEAGTEVPGSPPPTPTPMVDEQEYLPFSIRRPAHWSPPRRRMGERSPPRSPPPVMAPLQSEPEAEVAQPPQFTEPEQVTETPQTTEPQVDETLQASQGQGTETPQTLQPQGTETSQTVQPQATETAQATQSQDVTQQQEVTQPQEPDQAQGVTKPSPFGRFEPPAQWYQAQQLWQAAQSAQTTTPQMETPQHVAEPSPQVTDASPQELAKPQDVAQTEEVAQTQDVAETQNITQPEEVTQPQEGTQSQEVTKPSDVAPPQDVTKSQEVGQSPEVTEPQEVTKPSPFGRFQPPAQWYEAQKLSQAAQSAQTTSQVEQSAQPEVETSSQETQASPHVMEPLQHAWEHSPGVHEPFPETEEDLTEEPPESVWFVRGQTPPSDRESVRGETPPSDEDSADEEYGPSYPGPLYPTRPVRSTRISPWLSKVYLAPFEPTPQSMHSVHFYSPPEPEWPGPVVSPTSSANLLASIAKLPPLPSNQQPPPLKSILKKPADSTTAQTSLSMSSVGHLTQRQPLQTPRGWPPSGAQPPKGRSNLHYVENAASSSPPSPPPRDLALAGDELELDEPEDDWEGPTEVTRALDAEFEDADYEQLAWNCLVEDCMRGVFPIPPSPTTSPIEPAVLAAIDADEWSCDADFDVHVRNGRGAPSERLEEKYRTMLLAPPMDWNEAEQQFQPPRALSRWRGKR